MTGMSPPTDLVRNFADALKSGDLDRLIGALGRGCLWEFPATGEAFRGVNEVRMLLQHTVASPTNTGEPRLSIESLFLVEDAACIELRSRPPAGGASQTVRICLVCRIKSGAIDSVREYSDFGALAGTSLFPK